MTTIKLSQEDLDELLKVTKEAETTPVIALTGEDALSGNDQSSQAWRRVQAKWVELGKKYSFNPTQVQGIDKDTREVLV